MSTATELGIKKRTLTGQIEEAETRSRVLRLIRQGARADEVGEALDISPERVRAIVKRYLNHVHQEDSSTLEELRTLENERLDAMEKRLHTRLARITNGQIEGDPLKIEDRLLKLYERRARLNGLDAPMRVEHSGGVEVLHELGIDPEFIARSEEAFRTSFYSEGSSIPDPVIDGTCEPVDVDEALKQLEQ